MSLKGSFVKHYYHCDMPHLVYSVEREPKHRRRVRYKGTHPRRFEEKYKELDPLKYADTVEKVIRKGSTPAGMHISICVREILDFLKIRPGQTGLDATLGYGGHTQKMLECLKGEGHLFALDVDPIELAKTRERLGKCGYGPEILTIRQMNFADIDQLAAAVSYTHLLRFSDVTVTEAPKRRLSPFNNSIPLRSRSYTPSPLRRSVSSLPPSMLKIGIRFRLCKKISALPLSSICLLYTSRCV